MIKTTNKTMHKIILTILCYLSVMSHVYSEELTDGYYNEYFLGSKSGGPWFHDELAKQLKIMVKGKPLSVLCVKGPDSTTSTGIDVEKYRKNNPVTVIVEKCKRSGWVYVGPYISFQLANKSLNYYSGAMLHTIPSKVLACKSLKCRVIK